MGLLGRLFYYFVKEMCSGQINPDTQLSRCLVSAGGIPSLY